MRLSEWRAAAPVRPSVDPKVLGVVTPTLEALGAGRDPHCWVVWGDDVISRWQLLVPTLPGLLVVFVRVNVPGEGPRASAKLVRWGRVQVGELAIETQGGHRILSFSVENAILKGVDHDADRVAGFALGLVQAVDGRLTDVDAVFGVGGGGRRATRGSRPTPGTAPTRSRTSGSTGSQVRAKPSRATSAPSGSPAKASSAKPGAAGRAARRPSG